MRFVPWLAAALVLVAAVLTLASPVMESSAGFAATSRVAPSDPQVVADAISAAIEWTLLALPLAAAQAGLAVWAMGKLKERAA